MAKKVDGVIEAVRYKDGQIEEVRAFERRGAAYSDRIMIPREKLLKRLKDGKKFVIGQRKEFFAGTFETGKPVQVVSRGDREFISTRGDAERDELEQAPVF
jgi:hypothetical protein